MHVGLKSSSQYGAQYIIHLKSMQLRHNAMLAMCMYDHMFSKCDYLYLSVRLSAKSTVELTVDLTVNLTTNTTQLEEMNLI